MLKKKKNSFYELDIKKDFIFYYYYVMLFCYSIIFILNELNNTFPTYLYAEIHNQVILFFFF